MRNKFAVVCDVCGRVEKELINSYYRLNLPTYNSEVNNGVKTEDYCYECYKKLKEELKNFYNKEKENNNAE